MSDYTCPDCGGGFPTTAADGDACPWCGEQMARGNDRPVTPSARPTRPPTDDLPVTPPSDPQIGGAQIERAPFWDSGIRCDDSTSPHPAKLLDPDRVAKVGVGSVDSDTVFGGGKR